MQPTLLVVDTIIIIIIINKLFNALLFKIFLFLLKAFNKLDSIENKMALSDLSDSSTVHSQIYSELIDAMEESTEPAILFGTEILNTVGHDTYGAIVRK